MAVLLAGFCLPYGLKAQSCDPAGGGYVAHMVTITLPGGVVTKTCAKPYVYCPRYLYGDAQCEWKDLYPLIRVGCEEGEEHCCEASFEANIFNDCGVLHLTLDARCEDGVHHWNITSSE